MKVLMLGNGFDLSYGLLTKYSNFLNIVSYLEKQTLFADMKISDIVGCAKLHEIDGSIARSYAQHKLAYEHVTCDINELATLIHLVEDNIWFKYLQASFNRDVGWIDFEKEIGIVIQAFQQFLKHAGRDFVTSRCVESDAEKYIIEYFHFFYVQKSPSPIAGAYRVHDDYLLEMPLGSKNYIINQEKVIGVLTKALQALAEALRLYLKHFVQEVVEVLKAQGNLTLNPLLSGAHSIITFNYTNTYEMIAGPSEVFHLHGAIDKQIVLGVNPDECDKVPTADTMFISFKKYFQRVMARTDVAYIEWINSVLSMDYEIDLVVMGHSLDITDQDIIVELFEASQNITILYHDEIAEAGYIANLVKIFGMEKFNEMRHVQNLKFVPQLSTASL